MSARSDSRREWRQGWHLVLASAVGCGFAATNAITLGTFIAPLSEAYGWSRAEITTCLSIGALGTIFLTPLLGRALDYFGARRIALIGVPAYSFGIALLGTAGPSVSSWYAAWGALAFLSIGMSPVAWTLAVASRFDRSRGFALAVVLAGMSIATAILPLYAVYLISAFGWREAYWIIAMTILAVAWPLTWLWFYDARDLDRTQRAERSVTASTGPSSQTGLLLAEAVRTGRFWRIVASLALVGGSYSALYVHFQPILIDSGATPERAALVAGTIGPASLFGRLLTGFLLDRLAAPAVAGTAFALPIISCLLLRGYDGDILTASIAIAFAAMAAGAEVDLIAYLASRYFGMRSFGSIYGLIFSGHTVGWAIMPIIAGRVFDQTRSYDTALTMMIFMLAASALLAATLGRYPRFERGEGLSGDHDLPDMAPAREMS